jgi:transcriptional regulator with XRE-family HTH domain
MVNLFGERLRVLREEKNMSQEELAEAFGLGKAAISGYERGKRTPSFDLLVGLADYFQVSTDYLLGRTDDRTPPEDMERVRENTRKLHDILTSLDPQEQEKFFTILEVAVNGIKSQNRPN